MALVGALAADVAPAPAGAPPAVVDTLEVSFSTHVGEGAAGRKRFRRDGCYQVESGGGTGGAGHARDSQAGCHRPADVAAAFARLAALAAGNAVVRDSGGPRGAAGGARADPEAGPGGSQTRVVLVRPDGSRWVAASAKIAQELVAAVNALPSENQWYAEPPAPPLGTGPQLLVLSATAPDRRLEASLASDGRWWCHLSVIGPRGSEQKLPAAGQAGAHRRAGAPGAHPGGGPPAGRGRRGNARRRAAVRGVGRGGLARSAARGPAPALAEPPRHPALRHRDGSTVPRLHAGPALG